MEALRSLPAVDLQPLRGIELAAIDGWAWGRLVYASGLYEIGQLDLRNGKFQQRCELLDLLIDRLHQ